jgi:hypothetical protein
MYSRKDMFSNELATKAKLKKDIFIQKKIFEILKEF